MASTTEVLNLPELLEIILLELPTRDLLLAQRVCITWKAAITSSPNIQRALFFRPGSAEDIYQDSEVHIYARGGTSIAGNQLLLDKPVNLITPNHSPVIRQDTLDTNREPSCHRMFVTQPPVALHIKFHESIYLRGGLYQSEVGVVGANQKFNDLAECYYDVADRYGVAVGVVQLASGEQEGGI
ncbi:hypothetical protein LTR10_009047 [Elasticomyces elasticus]|nr:hypothetical protein LTR10_009047 [Elasticomyces elasticus]